MTCKEFEKLIPAFLEERMDFLTLKNFNAHMSECSECYEELEIQFLVTKGMQRLEDGDAFDLQNELEEKLEDARNRIKFHSLFLYLGAGLETIAIAVIIGFAIWMLIYYFML